MTSARLEHFRQTKLERAVLNDYMKTLETIRQKLAVVIDPGTRWFKASQNKARELGKLGFAIPLLSAALTLVFGFLALCGILNLCEIVLSWLIATLTVLYYGLGAVAMFFLVTFFGQIALTGFRSRHEKKDVAPAPPATSTVV